MNSIAVKSLGDDGVLSVEHLDNPGGPDQLSIDGIPVCLYGVHSDRENIYGHNLGGNAFWAIEMGVGCQHA